jgi:hypothetical protein
LAVADESAESVKDGSNQVKVNGQDVVKVLSIELEGMDSIDSLYRMNSWVTIKSRHGPKGLFFAYLADELSITLGHHSAL